MPIARVTLDRALAQAVSACVVAAAALLLAPVAPTRGQPPAVRPPCGLEATRDVAPRVVGAGEAVTITVAWDFDCRDEPQPALGLLLLVEDTAALAGVDGGLPGRVRAGLTRLVDAVDVARGGRIGLTRYGPSGAEWRTPLATGEPGRAAVRSAIAPIQGRLGGFAHAVAALEDAAAQLLATPSDVARTVLLVDSGAPLVSGTNAQGAILRCLALRDEGIRVVVVSLATADRRLEGCAQPGDFWASTHPDGHDLARLFDRLELHLLGDPYMTSSAFTETLAAGWSLIGEGSRPRVPDDILADGVFAWYEPAPPPPGGHRVAYRIRAPAVSTPVVAPAGRPGGPRVGLGRADGSVLETPLDDPAVCVYPAGAPQACATHAAGLTATAARPSPTATPSPPRTPPTPTSVFTAVATGTATATPTATRSGTPPTPTVTATSGGQTTPPPPGSGSLYLPLCQRGR